MNKLFVGLSAFLLFLITKNNTIALDWQYTIVSFWLLLFAIYMEIEDKNKEEKK